MINVQNISSKLASLPDQALKQYAEMHKEDPYVFSLALSESNRRKQIRSQGQQAMPQPKVVDQELADMDMRKELPENLGIAKLPVDMNMASGGIVAFDDGGYVPRYKEKGLVEAPSKDALRKAIVDEATAQGVDPALALQISGVESSMDPSARPIDPVTGKPRSSAKGLFQVIDKTYSDLGGDPKKRSDPFENIRVGVKSLAYTQDSLSKQLGRKPDAAEMYTGHFLGAETGGKILQADPKMSVKDFLKNTDPDNADKIIKANPEVLSGKKVGDVFAWTQKKMAPVLTAMVPASQAIAQTAQPTTQSPEVDRSFMGQLKSLGQGIARIPGAIGNVVAPEGTGRGTPSNWTGGYAPGTRNFFERAADQLGIDDEYQRNISNTLNALGGLPSPAKIAPLVGKLSPAAQAAKVAGEADVAAAAQKAASAEAKIANLRLPAPASTKQGIEALTEEERLRRGLGTPVVPAKPLPDVNTLSEAERLKRGLSPRGPVFQLGPDALKMQQELLARRGQVGNIGAKGPTGIEALTPKVPPKTFPIGQEAAEMQQKMQAARQAQALRNLEADKAAAEAARKGVTEATDASKAAQAVDAVQASKVANAANKVITPVNKAVTTAREVQAARNLDTVADKVPFGSDDTEFKPDYQPDTSRGYPAPVSPAVDDRTERDPANYKPEEKKQIVAAAKDAVPKSEDTDGWSKNDWLQFGLALMAGKSSNALTNVGEAGLSLLASKQARESEKNKLDLYKTVHAEKPGQSIQIAERLMAADKNLSFEDALAKATALTGGATKEALSDTRAEQVRIQNLKNFNAAKDKLDEKYSPLLMSGNSPTSKGMRAKYEADLQALREIHSIPTSTGPVATAASASGWGVPQKQ